MANNQPISPQGYNILRDPTNTNPFWDDPSEPTVDHGLIPGGKTGEALIKASDADYDVVWAPVEGGGTGEGITLEQAQELINQNLIPVNSELADHLARIVALEQAETGGITEERVKQLIKEATDPIIEVNTGQDLAISNLAGRLTTAEGGITSAQSDITIIKTLITDINEELTEETANRIEKDANLQEQIDNINTIGYDDTEVRQLIAGNTAEIASVKSDLSEFQTDTGENFTAVNSNIDALGTRVETAETTITGLGSRVDVAEADIGELKATSEGLRDDLTNTEVALGGRIDEVSIAIVNEADIRANADAGLQGNIDNVNASLGGRLNIVEARADEAYEYATELNEWKPTVDTRLSENEAAITATQGNIDTLASELNGGTTGQVLTKNSDNDREFIWTTPSSGGGGVVRETSHFGVELSFELSPTSTNTTVATLPNNPFASGPVFELDYNFDDLYNYDYVELSGFVKLKPNAESTTYRPSAAVNAGFAFQQIIPTYDWGPSGSSYGWASCPISLIDGSTLFITFLPNFYTVTLMATSNDPTAERYYIFNHVNFRVVRYV